jgi:hypothetical protein
MCTLQLEEMNEIALYKTENTQNSFHINVFSSFTFYRRGMKRRSGGSSTDGHLGGSSSSLSQGPASNDGSTFSIPRSSSRVTESGYATSVLPVMPPLPFGNYTPGNVLPENVNVFCTILFISNEYFIFIRKSLFSKSFDVILFDQVYIVLSSI